MAITKPPVLPAWAESGDKVTPSNAEIQVGWPLSSIPPSRQRFNWLLNFLANGVRYFTRRGLPDYDAAETYMTGDRIIGDDGKTYRSLIDNNIAQTPSAQPTKWELWALTQAQSDLRVQNASAISSVAGGTADAITGSYTPGIAALTNGMALYVRATSANATTSPTFTPNSGTIAAKAIVKGAGSALVAGDIAGGGHWIELQYDSTLDKWVLLNPAKGITAVATALVVRTADYTTSASSPSKITWTTLKQDPLGLWDAANNQFVIQKAGMYDVRSAIHITPGSAVECYYHALINGSTITNNSKSFSGGTYNGLSVLNFSSRMRLNAGDTLAMYVFGPSLPVTSFSDENHCWFELTYTGEN